MLQPTTQPRSPSRSGSISYFAGVAIADIRDRAPEQYSVVKSARARDDSMMVIVFNVVIAMLLLQHTSLPKTVVTGTSSRR